MRPAATLAVGLGLGVAAVLGANLPAHAQACSADLAIRMTASPDPVTTGHPLTYTIEIANAGPGPAGSVILTDSLPRNVALDAVASGQGTCRPAGSGVMCELGTIAAGATVTVRIDVTALGAGALTNNAAHVTSPADCNSANDDVVLLTTVRAETDPDPVVSLLGEFVAQFYTVVLGRAPEAGAVDAWVGLLLADPQNARFIVRGFFSSTEFLRVRQGRVADYVALLYETVLGRTASPAELAAWEAITVDRLAALVPGFVNSVEFQDRLRRTPASDVVTRLYRNVLGREPAPQEVTDWVAILQRTGDWVGVSLGFLNSREYLDGVRSFGDHVVILYETFLDRTPAAAEVDAWLRIVGELLAPIQDGFVNSPEFQQALDELL